jgi:hypothetical protein
MIKLEAGSMNKQVGDLAAILDIARSQLSDQLADDSARDQAAFKAIFDAAVSVSNEPAPVHIFIFHAEVPAAAAAVSYRDIQIDHSKFDYDRIIEHCIKAGLAVQKGARIVLVTDQHFGRQFAHPNLTVVRLPLDTSSPMYQRVVAMSAYVESKLFTAPTVFLDGDAFLNVSINSIFKAPFDVAVTYRHVPGLMPINEGVLFANIVNKAAVKMFFRAYLGTYDRLRVHADIATYYGDIKRWRGGQLSLNALTCPLGMVSELDTGSLGGARIIYYPCDTFNFSMEADQNFSAEELNSKAVLHLKGARKVFLETIAKYQTQRHPGLREISIVAAKPSVGGKTPSSPVNPQFVSPHFALFNATYREPPFNNEGTMQAFTGGMQTVAQILRANAQSSGTHLADDLFVWFRNLGFTEDPLFCHAMAPYLNDHVLRARIWRVYTLCWAAKSCLALPGDFVDVGCYDGKTIDVIRRFCDYGKVEKDYVLYDLFDYHPTEQSKVNHGPELYGKVREMFADMPRLKAIKGFLPDTMNGTLPEKIAFAQIDLNSAAVELDCLRLILDRMTSGGIIIFDDYGFKRYHDSHVSQTAYAASQGQMIFESPTGQGILIKR